MPEKTTAEDSKQCDKQSAASQVDKAAASQEPVWLALTDSNPASPSSPRSEYADSEHGTTQADITELTIPDIEEGGRAAWREAYTLPATKTVPMLREVEGEEDGADGELDEEHEQELQAMLLKKRTAFVEKLKNLQVLMKLRPGWIEERVSTMEATWRKEYVRELDSKAAGSVEGKSQVDGGSIVSHTDIETMKMEDKAEVEIEVPPQLAAQPIRARTSKLPRSVLAGTMLK